MTQAEIKALIDEKITSNGAQEITGEVLNDVLQEIADACGYTFDIDVYPADAALEITFYNPDNPDGVPMKINAEVSNLGNSKLEAISAWWAAQTERKLNKTAGYDIDLTNVSTSPSTLGVTKVIEAGQIIQSFTGASKLIFGATDATNVTVNSTDLPYTATKTLYNVKLESGTAANLKITVANGIVSVSQNTETEHIDIKVGNVTTPVASVKDVDKLRQSDSMMFDRLSLGNQYASYYWGVINGAGKWTNINNNHQHRLFPVKSGDTIILTAGNSKGNYAFLNSVPFPIEGDNADLVTGTSRTDVTRNTTVTVTAPADGYLYVSYMYSGGSTAFASILINDVDVVKKWDDIVKEAVKVPTIENHLSVIDSEINTIGVFRMQESGTPKGTTVAAPAQAGKKYKLGIKVDSGSLGANFVAYNGDTAIQQVSDITDGIEITVVSNATRTAIYYHSSNTGVNPQITFTDTSGVISKIEREVEEKADTVVVEKQIDDIYEGLKRYNVKVSDGKSVDVPITKVPNGFYQIGISVVSGTLIGNLNGYDTNNNILFSYTLQEYTKKAIPDCDHMKVYLGSQNTATGTVLIFTSFGSILKDDNQTHNVPRYVFTIDNKVRIPVIVYQEGIDKKQSDETLNGGIGIVFNPKDGSGQRLLRIESKNTYEENNISQIAASVTKNVSGVRILSLGDSLTWNNSKNPLTEEYDKWRNWVSYMTYLSLIHNKDNNCGVITQLGTRYHNVGFDYKEEHFYQKVFLEATTGWSAADYLYHPFQMKLIGASATIFGTPEVWYAKGLATKTPYDADSYNVDYEDWTGSDEQQALLQNTPMGRYKIDHVQAIWDKIKIIDTTFHQGESWTGSAQQKSDIDAWMLAKMENPENHLYSLEQARAYTGSHVWTYDYAISIEKYLERYRTMDNNGNRLYFDANGSTTGTAGSSNIGYLADGTPTAYYLGAEVSDTMAYNVCEPTHVIVNLGTNGGYSQPSMDNLDDILTYMKSKINHVGYMIPRFDNGVFNIGRWKGVVPHEITENMYNYEINKYMMDKYAGNITDDTKVQYIPAYAVQCPYSSILDTYAINDFGEKTYCQSKADGHIGWLANRDVGLQAYGWLLNTL